MARDGISKMNESDRTPAAPAAQGQGQDSIDARRRILRSLGAGGAVGALPSLAQATGSRPHCKKDSKDYHATASRVGSMIGSVAAGAIPKYGHNCSHYTLGGWGSGWHNGQSGIKNRIITWDNCGRDRSGASLTWRNANCLRFWVLFGYDSDPGGERSKFCYEILRGSTASSENIWLVALLNANKLSSTFPYTQAGVVSLHHGFNPNFSPIGASPDANLHAKAMTLFRDYLSQVG